MYRRKNGNENSPITTISMNDRKARYCSLGLGDKVSIWVLFVLCGTIYGKVELFCVGVVDGDGDGDDMMFVGTLEEVVVVVVVVGFAVKGREVGIAVGG